MLRRNLTVLADFHQFRLRDGDATYVFPEHWREAAVADRFLLPAHDGAATCVGILSAKNYLVPVTILVLDAEPAGDEEALATWDHVLYGALAVPSGRLVLAGGTVKEHDLSETPLAAGTWRMRVASGNLARDEEIGGDDFYRIEVWPGESRGWSVVKRWSPPATGMAEGGAAG